MNRSFIAALILLLSADSLSGTIFVNGKIGVVAKTTSGMEFEVVNSDYIGCSVVKFLLSDIQKPFSVQIKANQLKLYSDKNWDVAVSTNLEMQDCTVIGSIIKTESSKPLNVYIW